MTWLADITRNPRAQNITLELSGVWKLTGNLTDNSVVITRIWHGYRQGLQALEHLTKQHHNCLTSPKKFSPSNGVVNNAKIKSTLTIILAKEECVLVQLPAAMTLKNPNSFWLRISELLVIFFRKAAAVAHFRLFWHLLCFLFSTSPNFLIYIASFESLEETRKDGGN